MHGWTACDPGTPATCVARRIPFRVRLAWDLMQRCMIPVPLGMAGITWEVSEDKLKNQMRYVLGLKPKQHWWWLADDVATALAEFRASQGKRNRPVDDADVRMMVGDGQRD